MYRVMWLCFVVLGGAVGLWGSVYALPPGGGVALFVITALGAGCLVLPSPENDRPAWRQAIRQGINWGAGVVASVGLIALLGNLGVVIVLVLVFSSPTAVNATRRFLTRTVRPEPVADRWEPGDELRALGRSHPIGVDGQSPPGTESLPRASWLETPLGSMDDPTLCFAWRSSYVTLQRPLSLNSRARLVDKRQEFLDELERRHPRGFSAWLESGARAAGDPSKYIAHEERRTDH